MPLAQKTWQPADIHEVALEFLRAERHRLEALERQEGSSSLADDLALINRADLADPLENHRRWRLLYLLRAPLFAEIPPDTEWFRVDTLTGHELDELHIIARCGWDDPEGRDRNELRLAARRNPKTLKTMPIEWPSPVLFGHGKDGPFTIIEGNNRLAGYAVLKDPPPLNIPVFIGLSQTPFYFHIFDPESFIAADFWQHGRRAPLAPAP
jgi:hypothetical protein